MSEVVPFAGLAPVPPLTRFSLRGHLSTLASALVPTGVPISEQVCRAVEQELGVALWLGPDEQLLLTHGPQAESLARLLRENLTQTPHSLVDISQRQIAFEITGPNARTLLNSGCPLDLGESAFPVGMCTRTLFEKCEIVLWKRAPDTFHVEVWRSFAPYLTGLLARSN
jgi:sarcosine oxidase subunit gamma